MHIIKNAVTGEIVQVPLTQAEIDSIAAQAAASEKAAALNELSGIDLATIRAIREYIASKPDAPQIIKDRETAAQAARAKLK